MAESAQPKFACPSCGRQFTWKPELAGRSAKCKCGNTIKVPAQPAAAGVPAAAENPLDGYDFQEPAPPPKRAAAAAPAAAAGLRCPSCRNPLAAGAVICVHCGFNLKTGKRMSTVMGGDDAPGGAAAPVPADPAVPGAFAAPPGIRPPRRQEEGNTGNIVKLIAIPVILVGVVGGAVFGFKKLSGETDTGPKLGRDADVRALIKDDGATELKQWLKEGSTRLVNGMTREQADAMADNLYQMGAVKVLAFGGVMTMSLAIELPQEKEKRDAIFAWYKRKYESELSPARRQRDEGQRYILFYP